MNPFGFTQPTRGLEAGHRNLGDPRRGEVRNRRWGRRNRSNHIRLGLRKKGDKGNEAGKEEHWSHDSGGGVAGARGFAMGNWVQTGAEERRRLRAGHSGERMDCPHGPLAPV